MAADGILGKDNIAGRIVLLLLARSFASPSLVIPTAASIQTAVHHVPKENASR